MQAQQLLFQQAALQPRAHAAVGQAAVTPPQGQTAGQQAALPAGAQGAGGQAAAPPQVEPARQQAALHAGAHAVEGRAADPPQPGPAGQQAVVPAGEQAAGGPAAVSAQSPPQAVADQPCNSRKRIDAAADVPQGGPQPATALRQQGHRRKEQRENCSAGISKAPAGSGNLPPVDAAAIKLNPSPMDAVAMQHGSQAEPSSATQEAGRAAAGWRASGKMPDFDALEPGQLLNHKSWPL